MKPRYLFMLLCIAGSGSVQAEIYKSIDREGHVTYSSTPSRGAKKLGLDPLAPSTRSSRSHTSKPSYTPRASSNKTPADFPRVDSRTQKKRDSKRYRILADELATEEKLLEDARKSREQADAAHAESKSRTLQEEISLHEQNVSALKTELAHLK